jgi:hypothetical protein
LRQKPCDEAYGDERCGDERDAPCAKPWLPVACWQWICLSVFELLVEVVVERCVGTVELDQLGIFAQAFLKTIEAFAGNIAIQHFLDQVMVGTFHQG